MKKIIILFLLLLLSGCGENEKIIESEKIEVDVEENVVVDLNSEVYNTQFINEIKNGTIISEKEIIDTTKIGEKKVTLLVKGVDGKKEEYSYTINVVDNEAPVIKYEKEITTNYGIKVDLLKGVAVSDNSEEDINVKVDGEYNFNKADTYKLYYVAIDSSGNETREEFTLIVKQKKVEVSKDDNVVIPDGTFTTSKGFSGYTKNGITYIDGILIVNKTYSLPSNYGTGLSKATKEAFNEMQAAAILEGLNIYLSSGFRSYSTQKNLNNKYVNRDGQKAADTYSARAGHSEHQSGLAFDVNQINDTFSDTVEAKWLANNCYKYGLILRYPKGKTYETGYKYESWHFRYVGVDLATKLYNNGDWITLEDYFGITSEYQK